MVLIAPVMNFATGNEAAAAVPTTSACPSLVGKVTTFSAPGSYEFSLPMGVTRVRIKVAGAGGSEGGGVPSGNGGNGALIKAIVSAPVGACFTAVVGAGGGYVGFGGGGFGAGGKGSREFDGGSGGDGSALLAGSAAILVAGGGGGGAVIASSGMNRRIAGHRDGGNADTAGRATADAAGGSSGDSKGAGGTGSGGNGLKAKGMNGGAGGACSFAGGGGGGGAHGGGGGGCGLNGGGGGGGGSSRAAGDRQSQVLVSNVVVNDSRGGKGSVFTPPIEGSGPGGNGWVQISS